MINLTNKQIKEIARTKIKNVKEIEELDLNKLIKELEEKSELFNKKYKNKMKKVICQDCSNIKNYTTKRHNSDEICECGGDFCGCNYCNEKIKKGKENGIKQSRKNNCFQEEKSSSR